MPRLRAAAAASDDVVDRLDGVLDESNRLIRDYPYLTASLRALRAGSTARLRRGGLQYPGSKALHEVVSEIIADAKKQGRLSPETDARSTVEAICALTRGLSEQADRLQLRTHEATLGSAKKLIRGTLFTPLED